MFYLNQDLWYMLSYICGIVDAASLQWTFSNASMELRNIILFTIVGFTLSYTRYGKPRNGDDVMQLHAHIWKGLLLNNIASLWLK